MSEEKQALSRRDFLKQASKDAAREVVETGSKIVPGGQIARRLLQGEEAGAEFAEEPRRHWWDRFVMRNRTVDTK
ncbi:MAG: hypothetical protein OHK0029_39030 [Armatimonadaceae bacterium]